MNSASSAICSGTWILDFWGNVWREDSTASPCWTPRTVVRVKEGQYTWSMACGAPCCCWAFWAPGALPSPSYPNFIVTALTWNRYWVGGWVAVVHRVYLLAFLIMILQITTLFVVFMSLLVWASTSSTFCSRTLPFLVKGCRFPLQSDLCVS